MSADSPPERQGVIQRNRPFSCYSWLIAFAPSGMEALFDAIDINNDGVIDRDEFKVRNIGFWKFSPCGCFHSRTAPFLDWPQLWRHRLWPFHDRAVAHTAVV